VAARLVTALGAVLVAFGAAETVRAQQTPLERLPAAVFDATPPSALVRGAPGAMRVLPPACRTLPLDATRRRIVDLAVQEWGFFGFRIAAPAEGGDNEEPGPGRSRRPRLPPEEAARVASSIGGYWAVTPEGSWIVARQNDRWRGDDGIAARWNAPWSAAFISWIMCEAGLGTTARFQRAIAHHRYIDQAIRARDRGATEAAFTAYDPGEEVVVPGDLLCSSRRPVYRTIDARRRQLGAGARSHCDIVVQVDERRRQVLAIGGNVRGVVSLKRLPAVRDAGGALRAETGDEDRPIFAHLKLRAAPIELTALDTSRTMARVSRSPLATD
jgi:hypothetical protein